MGLCYCLAFRWLPGTCPVSSHFTLYVTGTPPAVVLVLNPRVSGFPYLVRLCRPCKQSFLKIWQFLPLFQPPFIFTASRHGDLSYWLWNPGLCGQALGLDHLIPRYPSRFLSTTRERGTTYTHSATATTSPRHIASPRLSTLSLCFHPSYPSG